MIVVRDVFQLKFGRAREAVALWQEGIGFIRRAGAARDSRLLTDFAGGNYYTLVLESTYDSLADYEREMRQALDADWRTWYQRFIPLVDSGRREILNVVGVDLPPSPMQADAGAKTASR